MPKVRASSGMIGTTRSPNPGSRAKARSIRVNAVVVDAAFLPDPPRNSSNTESRGSVRGLAVRTVRLGSEPPSARRRPIR